MEKMVTNSAKQTAEIISKRIGTLKPKIGMILGSGLGAVSSQIQDSIRIPYGDLPNFTVSHIEGHASTLHLGSLKGTPVACLEGRSHTYEGHEAISVLKNLIRTLKLIGCEILLTTNAVGSLRKEVGPGSITAIKDHINFMFSNPLIGKNDAEFGERFVSMDNAYDKNLREKLHEIAKQNNIPLHESIYLATSGPTFETPAEINAYRILGADTVGMSTVPETIIARHCGLKVVSVSAVTNYAAGMSEEQLSHEQTLRGAKLAIDNLAKLFLAFVGGL